MNKSIRNSKITKVIACYLAIMIFLEITSPMAAYALTSGPKQPEFTAFTPISTSDMVNLASGDFNYNIPIMDVGGYPINLAYDSGVTMDQEASWVGLGWNLNIGQINRNVRGLPDDFKGDLMTYKNNVKDNVTIGTNFNISPALLGNDTPFNLGLGVEYNNYNGITFKPSIGVSYSLAGIGQVGCSLSGSIDEGATLSPSIGIGPKISENTSLSIGLSGGLNSRKGLENMGMSVSASSKTTDKNVSKNECGETETSYSRGQNGSQSLGSMGGSLSFNSQSYTPTKRIGFNNNNKTFNATLGGEVFGLEGQVRITGYGSVQSINSAYKNRNVPAYGYDYTHYKNRSEGVLDFNREKEQTINKNTNALPVTNYTYDIYTIQGQGVSGMFRPIRSQVSYLYNDDVRDITSSNSFGAEIGVGNLVHGGINFNDSPTVSKTGVWSTNNFALAAFEESNLDVNSNPLYQNVTYKLVGELDVDNEIALFNNRLKSYRPLRVGLDLDKINPSVEAKYLFKPETNLVSTNYTNNVLPLNTKIKRTKRLLSNQVIQKISAKETDEKFVFRNPLAKDHHTAGMKILQTDGSSYVYGKAVYNNTKSEATFDVSGRSDIDEYNGIVGYNGSLGGNNNTYSDKFENKNITPAYAHTFLVTSVLSSDYEDIDDNGPSDTDLGSYTKFHYTKSNDANYVSNYKWRIPYGLNKASYNEGLKCSYKDQKGNYIYGEKELVYLKMIETKTHIAFIDLANRNDAMSVASENGGPGNQAMKYISSIRLFSKPELIAQGITFEQAASDVDGTIIAVKPIKKAHFEYDYSLCKGIPSSATAPNGGKLTLKKVYFTYRSSNMGRFTPYVFNYDEGNPDANKAYHIKGFDIWGNYKNNPQPSNTNLSTSEFPFVEQDYEKAQKNTAMWTLKSIKLPSGGEIKITTESDDYKYVQNRKAMQMFMVVGAGDSPVPPSPNNFNNKLFTLGGEGHRSFIYVNTNDPSLNNSSIFKDRYLSENIDKPIYFKFLLRMNGSKYEYVTGYFEIDKNHMNEISVVNGYASIPLKFLKRDGGVNGNAMVNPIAKAGWGFGRTYLNRFVYNDGEEVSGSFVSIVTGLVNSIRSMSEIFTGPNYALEVKKCADSFNPSKSWIRLENPNGRKFGGGLRVKKIELNDKWDVMSSNEDNPLYNEEYGQEYSYNLEDGTSSGVAAFEPNSSPENPFVEPFYGLDNQNYAERINAPRENNYVEKPFGENFFPSPKVTYSKVTVKNLEKRIDDIQVRRHATGKVVTEHYTAKDFPTRVDYTDCDTRYYNYQSPILQMLSVYAVNHLTMSQGFTIETNDMDGKVRSQKVYAEGQNAPISSVEYKYNVDSTGKLDNEFTTINENGKIEKNLLGINYDVINDFNESETITEANGFDGNLASFLIPALPPIPVYVPLVLPREAYNETRLRTATTTKTIHRTGVLIETIAYDLGSRVATKNLAWDAKSGQILVTQTNNEFDDKYYSLNYPAYWYYKNMGMASENIDLVGKLSETVNGNGSYFYLTNFPPTVSANDINKFFKVGDELVFNENGALVKLWVYTIDSNHIRLMNKEGEVINSSNQPSDLTFKIVRSGNRNLQTASMASVTLMVNPIDPEDNGSVNYGSYIDDSTVSYNIGSSEDIRVINSSAIEYSDIWSSQCENDLPDSYGYFNGDPRTTKANPYLYNTKGDWRPIKSYAYLTGRNNFETENRRKSGYYNKFNPFYKKQDMNHPWTIDSTNWTFASRVTMYSPYGAELENKDALNRYSSAQYGYNYTLPVAVTSNAHYREIGFDGFEDYDPFDIFNQQPSALKPHFGFHQDVYTEKNVVITEERSHTGHRSVVVPPKSSIKFVRKVDGCPPEEEDMRLAPTKPKNKVVQQNKVVAKKSTVKQTTTKK
ncbi:hypothetical protein [Flavobacterium capsici]|uniref:Uncharacterized protein n=1 Tax=Flavobacterium capsici TaxID=3075618 RepID=A0AA96EYL7_9FLAO|nr:MULTISPECIES: hypothetical protein [unclassified Flavobacterium]WNM19470.1 hypothetical protein RN608_02025 [Flavobacterium sp. PMR2A8]WNM20859.1 hypothetical protein RN605_09195 [Flavobacterium sp. PMTSA4]